MGAFDAMFEKRFARPSAEQAARVILDGALRGSARLLVGADAHVVHALAKVLGW